MCRTLRRTRATEGVLRAFEAFSTDPQDNGYRRHDRERARRLPGRGAGPAVPPVKVYAPSASDAGDLRRSAPGRARDLQLHPAGRSTGEFGAGETTGTIPVLLGGHRRHHHRLDRGADRRRSASRASTSTPTAGRTTCQPRARGAGQAVHGAVPSDRHAAVQPPAADPHARAQREVQLDAEARARRRVGAAAPPNNAIAQQMLPGVGCQNPDKTGGEAGGWYTLLIHTPMSADIRPDVAGTLAEQDAQPLGAARPGRRIAVAAATCWWAST